MDKENKQDMEQEYDEQLEKEFVALLKGKVKRLPPETLREKIVEFLQDNKICTLATCAQNIPRSTPVRYRSKDLTLYILTEGGGKLKNIRENPHVSVSIVGEYSGFQSVKGLQMWGTAEIIRPEDKERYQKARAIIDLEQRQDLKQIGVINIRTYMYIIKIETNRARYLNFPEGILNQVLTIE